MLIPAKDHHAFIQIKEDYYAVMLCGHHICDVFRTSISRNWWIVYENRVEPAARLTQAKVAVRRYVAVQTLYLWPQNSIHVVA